MSREQLIAESRAAGQAARHNLRMIRKQPDRIDSSKRADAEAYLQMLIRFERYEMKNALRPGRTSFKTRIKSFIASIIAHVGQGKRAYEAKT